MHYRVTLESSNAGVEIVFDAIFSSTLHFFADAAPTGLELTNKFINFFLFLAIPISFFDFRVQNIDPSLSALLSTPAGDHF